MDIKKVRIKDFFSLERYRSVGIFLLRSALKKLEGKEAVKYEEVHIIEQYMFRIISCQTCVNNGACEHCGCAIPEKMWVRTDRCSNGKWGEFMSKEDWSNFKKAFNIKFKIEKNGSI